MHPERARVCEAGAWRTFVGGEHVLPLERDSVCELLLLRDPRKNLLLCLEHRRTQLLVHVRDHRETVRHGGRKRRDAGLAFSAMLKADGGGWAQRYTATALHFTLFSFQNIMHFSWTRVSVQKIS